MPSALQFDSSTKRVAPATLLWRAARAEGGSRGTAACTMEQVGCVEFMSTDKEAQLRARWDRFVVHNFCVKDQAAQLRARWSRLAV